MKLVSELGGDIISFITGGAFGALLVLTLRNPRLKWNQKILPALGYGVRGVMAVCLGAVIVFGLSALFTPFAIAAAIGGIGSSIAAYLEDRAERNNLRKQLVSRKDLEASIRALSDPVQKDIKSAIDTQREAYQELYNLRDFMIQQESIPLTERHQLVREINQAIEEMYKDSKEGKRTQPLKLSSKTLPFAMQDVLDVKVADCNKLINTLNDSQEILANHLIPAKTKRALHSYQQLTNVVYAQSLPLDTKEEFLRLLESNNVTKKDINQIYARMANHYINSTPLSQISLRDDNLLKQVPEEEKATVSHFLMQPRKVIDSFKKVEESISTSPLPVPQKENAFSDLEKLKQSFISQSLAPADMKSLEENCVALQKRLSVSDPSSQTSLQESFSALRAQLEESSKATALFEEGANSFKEKQGLEKLEGKIRKHCSNSVREYANHANKEFPSPKLLLEEEEPPKKRGLFKRALGVFWKGKRLPLDPSQQNKYKEEKNPFKRSYGGVLSLLWSKERLNVLNKIIPARVKGILLCGGIALASILMLAVIPLSAPVALAIIGGISTVLTLASVAKSLLAVKWDAERIWRFQQATQAVQKTFKGSSLEDPLKKEAKENKESSLQDLVEKESKAAKESSLKDILKERSKSKEQSKEKQLLCGESGTSDDESGGSLPEKRKGRPIR